MTELPDVATRLLRELGAVDHPQPTVNAVIELSALFTQCLAVMGQDPGRTRLATELGSAGRVQQGRLVHALTDAHSAIRLHLSVLGTVLADDEKIRTSLNNALDPFERAGERLESLAEQLDPAGISYR